MKKSTTNHERDDAPEQRKRPARLDFRLKFIPQQPKPKAERRVYQPFRDGTYER